MRDAITAGGQVVPLTHTTAAPMTRGRTTWPLDGLADVGHLVTSLTAAAGEASVPSLVPCELSPLEYEILDRCHRNEANTVTELAHALPVDASVMSRQVSKLVDKGLLSRQRLSSDRRTIRLRPTPNGRSLARSLAEESRARQRLLMQGVSDDERAAFRATAHKILANLEELASRPPRRGRETGSATRFSHAEGSTERMTDG